MSRELSSQSMAWEWGREGIEGGSRSVIGGWREEENGERIG
jgi:hypothetical protein